MTARLPHRLVLFADDARLAVPLEVELSDACEVAIAASLPVWNEMLAPVPRPGRQSAGAATREGGFEIRGDRLAVAQSLPLVEMLIEAMRKPNVAAPACRPQLERIEARYLEIGWPDDDRCWLFEESAGDPSQPVLLLLHTAGADSRQWHGLMSNEALGRRWRMVAFDMPCHGRSRPPGRWRGEPWRLDSARYLACIRAWMSATGTRKLALAGCSMGAAIGLAFLARHAELAHGAILLETPFRSPGRRTDLLDHPAVHGGRFGAAWVKALMSPSSPGDNRRFATWIYSQAAPGVYEGDLEFYSDEFDAGTYVNDIDAGRTPLWLLSGDYDYSATPADGRRVAEAIPGARFVEMNGLGHFPMTEDPARLLEHFA
ncbi:MAG TPA: alpha/beta fold hydrolase, partial [Burkholderiaceae bacterium]|nr:alpha/beta fold hydrolase [Burkholderiaceae bacterium]